MKLQAIILILLSLPEFISAQADSTFKPRGKPVFVIFSNFHSTFSDEGNASAFEVTRFYLGYEYDFSKSLSARANVDIGDPGAGNLQMTAYLKNAFLQYRRNGFTGRVGMIGTDEFNLIEKQWGHRYVFKTLQDEYGFGPSADLGAAVEYSPSKFISLDASVLNGEGFRKLQSDSVFKYTAGMTLKPFSGFRVRAYTDLMKKDYVQNTVSLFAGYSYESLNAGVEYSIQKNNRMTDGHDMSGLSVFASMNLSDGLGVLAMYDNVWSSEVEGSPWNHARDGQIFITGLEFLVVKGIRVAPVYIGWLPGDDSMPFTSRPGIYIEIKL